jgi:hypothetical protein
MGKKKERESMTAVPSFSQEVEEGNVEYKWKLVNTTQERLVHLTTQLNWRLNESESGEAIYLIGTCFHRAQPQPSAHCLNLHIRSRRMLTPAFFPLVRPCPPCLRRAG